MSHPLIVEAIEELFVPVLIYNNKDSDAKLLKQFNEPSWNNPVFRFLDSSGDDVIPRKDNIWASQGVVDRMLQALQVAKRPVPEYLKLLGTQPKLETAEFAMHCYWEGEAKLGSLPGVYSTRSGWRGKLEVVEVQYDPQSLEFARLVDEAQKFKCASKVFTHTPKQMDIAKKRVGDRAATTSGKMRDAKTSDQKYYLRASIFRHLPLTETQATKLNAVLAPKSVKTSSSSWQSILSPRQQKLLEQIKATDPTRVADLIYPANEKDLPAYAEKLAKRLK